MSGVDFFLRQYVNYEDLSMMFATNRLIYKSMLLVIFERNMLINTIIRILQYECNTYLVSEAYGTLIVLYIF